MTMAEHKLFLEAYYEREKRKAKEISLTTYNVAKLTANFVGLALNGKSIPPYDSLFAQDTKPSSSSSGIIDEKAEAAKVTAYLWDFAMKHNAQRHKQLERVGEVK